MRHIETVRNHPNTVIRELITRQEQHDQSKLQSPEAEAFEILTPKLRGLTYGSEEYRATLRAMKPAIDHHYANNPSHHPEAHERGIRDMNLINLIEMICDWQSASMRHGDGDIMESIKINQGRFGYSDELREIFENTARWLVAERTYHHAKES